jgi:hypothetical protein
MQLDLQSTWACLPHRLLPAADLEVAEDIAKPAASYYVF